MQKKLLESHVFYNQKYQSEGDRYFEGMCDGLDLAIQEIDKFIGADSDEVTLDNLIDVAVQAVRDGKIEIHHFHKDHIEYAVIGDAGTDAWRSDCKDEIEDHIEYIKSLYTETFVIESEDDIERVKRGAKIVLSNGSEFIAELVTQLSRGRVIDSTLGYIDQTYGLFILKGATVTQKRGSHD